MATLDDYRDGKGQINYGLMNNDLERGIITPYEFDNLLDQEDRNFIYYKQKVKNRIEWQEKKDKIRSKNTKDRESKLDIFKGKVCVEELGDINQVDTHNELEEGIEWETNSRDSNESHETFIQRQKKRFCRLWDTLINPESSS